MPVKDQLLTERDVLLMKLNQIDEQVKEIDRCASLDPGEACSIIENDLAELTPENWTPDFLEPGQDKWLPMYCYRSGRFALQSCQQQCVVPHYYYRPKRVWQAIITKHPQYLRLWLEHSFYA